MIVPEVRDLLLGHVGPSYRYTSRDGGWNWACSCGHILLDGEGFTAGILPMRESTAAIDIAQAHHLAEEVTALFQGRRSDEAIK